MSKPDESKLAELRVAFLRHLPRRVQSLTQRAQRFRTEGWDNHGLSMLHDDAQRLAGTAGRYGLVGVSERLLAVEGLLDERLSRKRLPDGRTGDRLLQRLEELAAQLPEPAPEAEPVAVRPQDGDVVAAAASTDAAAGEPPAVPVVDAPDSAACAAPDETSVGPVGTPGQGNGESPPRILIVEDDPSQALFAEGILRNAGMRTQLVSEPQAVLPALEAFRPDLVLMDLYLPQASGIELTAAIRERAPYMHLPIVFLSGEQDPDKQFETIDAGADDFLAKPVRPRHLLAAVHNRVRRARALTQRAGAAQGPHPGLCQRAQLLDRINGALMQDAADGPPPRGGVLFVTIEGVELLRERLELSVLERLLAAVAQTLVRTLDGRPIARFGDACFLVLEVADDAAVLEARALALRETLRAASFDAGGGRRLRLQPAIGVCAFEQGDAHRFGDAGGVLDAVAHAARAARADPRGVHRFAPQPRPEQARDEALVARIREALDSEGFELLYQPIVAVTGGGDQAQYQTLLRLRDHDGGLHTAAEVVPVAEGADLVVALDRWVLRQALATIGAHAAQGRALRLFVSQSAHTLGAPGQIEWVRAQLREHEVDAAALTLEVRLDDALRHFDDIQPFLAALAADGMRFGLGQFLAGDGECLLDRLPLACVKLAARYTAAAEPSTREELRALIDGAHRRNLHVIGHRVEDAQSAAILWTSGIDFIQGNLVQPAGRELAFDFQHSTP